MRRMYYRKFILCLLCLLAYSYITYAQPANDNCSNASVITIPNNGFDRGSFKSTSFDIAAATVQNGETFAPAIFTSGHDQKSIWYKFTLPTTRSVKVTLLQLGNSIPAGYAGYAIYKTNNCVPDATDLSTKFTPLAKFGSSYHPCVDPGDYLIQVSADSNAKGPLYIQLDVFDSSGAQYDHPKDAFDFGTINNSTQYSDFSVECQSIEDASETCTALANSKLYTKSTWHTFTTPAYFDYAVVMLASPICRFTNGSQTFGYTLYKGDVKKTAYASLTKISACDSLVSDGNYAGYKVYKCEDLQPNTTYSVQLFYKEDFEDDVRLSVGTAGTNATQAPEPILSKLPASNKLGKLNGDDIGITTNATDYFGCNSHHDLHACNPALPATGINFNGVNYNLSTFYTFQLATGANISISAGTTTCNYPLLISLYKQDITNACAGLDTANLIARAQYNAGGSCLSAGTYTLQISGTDSVQPYNSISCDSVPHVNCMLTNLGQPISLSINVKYVNASNKFSLSKNGAFDAINASGSTMKPLQNGMTYVAEPDTFGCSNTVLPPPPSGNFCNTNATKASYREFVIGDANGDNKADSGVVTFSYLYGNASGTYFSSVLYKGDANALANAQNAHTYGNTIQNLTPYSGCFRSYYSCAGEKVCLVPGSYTLATLGDDNHVGLETKPTLQFNVITTQHFSGATAQDMGSILDTLGSDAGTLSSDVDYFSCTDNAVTINGFAPPDINWHPATKAIYRQFYLRAPSVVSICSIYTTDCNYYNGPAVLFSGNASEGLGNLQVVQSTDSISSCITSSTCSPLPTGWYTVVVYGSGPTYAEPTKDLNEYGYSSAVGYFSQFNITVTPPCPDPQFNRPKKAAIDTITHQPFLLETQLSAGSTEAYPITGVTYTLYTESFNCTVDTPFTITKPCNEHVNRVAYYVLKINKESYLQINTQNFWAQVFSGDVRKDSASFKTATPIQPCLQSSGYIQLCRVQPGTYTLVIYADDSLINNGCGSVTPAIYIDNVGYSRFDHANNAYDFGTIPSDSIYYTGKPKEVNPLNAGRAASNDFFYCTTGSRESDPTESACSVDYNPNIYNLTVNNHLYDSSFLPNPWNVSRRNLWYTFVVDKPGNVHVKVNNKTSSNFHYPFAIYKSDVEGTLPFQKVVSTGQVDSTKDQGLTLIDYNLKDSNYYCLSSPEEISFYRDPCTPDGPTRYYVIVDDVNGFPDDFPGFKPNSQVEVSIMLDTVNAIATRFDHYYQANDIGVLSTGTYKGQQDNFICATADATDPVAYDSSCAKKTLWYKFTTTVTGHVKYRLYIDSIVKVFSPEQIQLFREDTPGDSTSAGLIYQNYGYSPDDMWGSNCVSPGTYYLIVTGCNQNNEFVFPEIQIDEEAGDFCSAPVVAAISGAGRDTARVFVDCHTIGTDYGEFAPQLSCPPNANTQDYKTSWYRLDIGGKDTLDVTIHLEQNTKAAGTEIKVNSDLINYRMMIGDCGAMEEQSCVKDLRTEDTYSCLIPGKSYYIQVFTPVLYNDRQVVGNIDLIVSSVAHTDTCAPDANCLATAKFSSQFDCTKDDSVKFVNFSTYGSNIEYKWDFGYNGQTSTDVSPSFFYPALATEETYNVKLSVLNKSCNGKDSIIVPVTVPGRPHVNLGNDIVSCNSDTSITLHATSFPGATYFWQNGATDSLYTINYQGQNEFNVEVTYNNCISRDSVNVSISPVDKKPLQSSVVCPGDSVLLYGGSYSNVTYNWNTGETNYYTHAKKPGTYWVDIANNNCVVRDSFLIAGISDAHPLGNDTTICFSPVKYYTLDATVNGANFYKWQDGQGSPQYKITESGTYWVDINFNTCTIRDSVVVSSGVPPEPVIKGVLQFCSGDSTMLDAGNLYATYLWSNGDTTRTINVKAPGDYTVTVSGFKGCSNTSLPVSITENPSPEPHITGNAILCGVSSLDLSVAESFTSYLWSNGTTTQHITADKPGMLSVIVTDNNDCTGKDSVTILSASSPLRDSITASLCPGAFYTLPWGKEISTAGVYSDTLRSAAGCDSLITTVNLSVLTPTITTLSATICSGEFYTLPSGRQVDAAGTYIDTLYRVAGCDSIISTTDLHVISPIVLSTAVTICAGSSYTSSNGVIVTEAGTYADTTKSVSGCDSLITTLTLTVLSPAKSELTTTICAGQVYTLPSGKTLSSPGTYTDTVYSSMGCDSLLTTVHLSLLTPSTVNQLASVCLGESYTLPSGKIVNTTGVYNDTLQNAIGCDSIIITVNLTVKEPVRPNLSASICSGVVYLLPSGRQVSQAGNYSDTIRSSLGCDSVISTVTLSKFSPIIRNTSASICLGQTYTLPSGKKVSVAGTYSDTLRSIPLGCDSIITNINLTATSIALTQNTAATICSGEVYTLPSGKKVSIAGNYTDTLTTKEGCDSLVTLLSLTVQPRPVFSVQPTATSICTGDSVLLTASGGEQYIWYAGNNSAYTAGPTILAHPLQKTIYTVVITSQECRDSLYSNVVVHPRPLLLLSKSNDISCAMGAVQLRASGGSSYTWFPASTLSNANVNNPVATPSVTTVYYVKTTSEYGCASEDSIEVKVKDSKAGYDLPSAFTPNGDGKNDCFGVKSWGAVTNLRFSVYDRTGTLLFRTTNSGECWDGTYNRQPLQPGTYIYQASANTLCGYVYRSSTVVLIR